ncbi:MAG: PhoPQ-activated protein PqaA family protein [Bacteroidota bacterium]
MKKRNLLITINLFAVVLLSACAVTEKEKQKEIPLTPETALEHYLQNSDSTYAWKIVDTFEVGGLKAHNLVLTSQKWREFIWKHQLTIFIPKDIKYDDALLFISGGSINKEGEPNFRGPDDGLTKMVAGIAEVNSAITTIIRQTPNQPLYEGDLVEDQLISYTLHNYKNDSDMTWPLLFPMVKTAVRAMDAIQEFSENELNQKVNNFVVTGASKRGWTTWLTGANDNRVKAIAPMVIDVLNMPVSLNYQIEVWKEYSVQIEDYVKLEIPQQVSTQSGRDITTMVDPYSYRKKLTMPKMIFIGTNDEYWPVDAIKNYFDSIPGENYIHYVPNAGHGLDSKNNDQSARALSAFFGTTIKGEKYPECKWEMTANGKNAGLNVKASSGKLIEAFLWSASSTDRDFRDEEWTSTSLDAKNKSDIDTKVDYPQSGFKAFYMDLKYLDPNGNEYTKSTRMFVVDSTQIL